MTQQIGINIIAWFLLLTTSASQVHTNSQQQIWQKETIHDGEDHGFALNGFQYKSFIVSSYVLCWLECKNDENCMSLNYDTTSENCSLNSQNKMSAHSYYRWTRNSYYRTMLNRQPRHGVWNKMNSSPVCFGCTDGTSSNFTIKHNGTVSRIKLVHLSGNLFNCNIDLTPPLLSRWGCKHPQFNLITTVITFANGVIILPTPEMIQLKTFLAYNVPGIIADSAPEILMDIPHNLEVTVGQLYKIWHGQDFGDVSESNNAGFVCIDVYLFGFFR